MSFKYFTLDEFACQETGENEIKTEFVERLDALRDACGFPFVITSGYRSPRHSIEAKKPNGPGQHASGIAADIAAIVTRKIGIHPIIGEIFEKVEERLMKATVKKDSIIIGKEIVELDLAARIGVDIIAIRRNKDWILDPNETEKIFLGDTLITRGAPLGIKEFKNLAEAKIKKWSTKSDEKKSRSV